MIKHNNINALLELSYDSDSQRQANKLEAFQKMVEVLHNKKIVHLRKLEATDNLSRYIGRSKIKPYFVD